jgi:hypothetical protein
MITWRSASLNDVDALSEKLNESAGAPCWLFNKWTTLDLQSCSLKYGGTVRGYRDMEADQVENNSVVTHN